MNESTHPPDPAVSGHAPKTFPLRLLYVESHWLSRRTIWYLMQDVECVWIYADNAAQAVTLVEKSHAQSAPFDVIVVDHHQTAGDSGLRVVRALREAGGKDMILAIGVEEISEIERQHYEKFDVPFLLLMPENHTDLKTAVLAAAGRSAHTGGETSA
ncbi:response regulator [Termitidicoccus mucosus]|uniref:Response regulator receiver protein n=1 Tax=Termitidicoccus mucosus TaxID=1184151 RepID=A0A178IPM5_9BACT|nr:response regulator receiver protein [Opitutaceae bacterium TSB47]